MTGAAAVALLGHGAEHQASEAHHESQLANCCLRLREARTANPGGSGRTQLTLRKTFGTPAGPTCVKSSLPLLLIKITQHFI